VQKCVPFVLCLLLVLPSFAQKGRLQESYTVLKGILGTPDKKIPRDLLDKATCVVICPSVKKAGFIVGWEYEWQKKQAPNSFGGVQRLQGFASLSVSIYTEDLHMPQYR